MNPNYKCIKSFKVSDVDDEDEWEIEVGSIWSCDYEEYSIRLDNLSDDSWLRIDEETLTEHFEAIQEVSEIKENDKILNTFTGEVYTFVKNIGDYFTILNSTGDVRDVGFRYFERYYRPYKEDLKIKKLEELHGDI